MRRTHFHWGALLSAASLIVACNDQASTGQMSVLLTDAPSPMIESATAYISTVYVIHGSDTTGPRDTISAGAKVFNLLELQNGLTAFLGTVTLPTGSYNQVRLVVDSATLTLKAPFQFSDGTSSRTLKVPSGMTSGIKVNFAGPVQIASGGHVIVVVDFDVTQNFVFTGPAGAPTGVLFKPVLHASVQSIAGSISGTVTPASSHAQLWAILGTDTVQTTFADTVSGAYTLRFLPPGTYAVAATGTGLSASKLVTLRTSQDTTGVNFP